MSSRYIIIVVILLLLLPCSHLPMYYAKSKSLFGLGTSLKLMRPFLNFNENTLLGGPLRLTIPRHNLLKRIERELAIH